MVEQQHIIGFIDSIMVIQFFALVLGLPFLYTYHVGIINVHPLTTAGLAAVGIILANINFILLQKLKDHITGKKHGGTTNGFTATLRP